MVRSLSPVEAGVDVEVAIVGAGFAGIGLAIQLLRHGSASFVVLEAEASAGGTWRDNTYPGCACDIPALLYSFSFAPNRDWTRVYPRQDEIRRYLERCIDRYDLRSRIRYGAAVDEARYDDATATWRLRTRDGGELVCRVLVAATGPLNRPNVPAFAGLDTFRGAAFHSMRWDHAVDLRDKEVVVIGTGASAVQFVPHVAPLARRLTLFARTPPWIVPRADRAIGARERARRRLPGYAWLRRKAIYWTLEARAYAFTVDPRILRKQEALGLRLLRRRIPDPALRAKLTPNYRMGCKRVLLSDDFYPALTRDNVAVVTSPIASFTPHGVVDADGVEHPADVVVFGTGFAATEGFAMRVVGRGGVELADAWRDGMQAYLGASVAGFPNFFTIIGPNTGLGHNSMVFMMEAQFRYVLSALRVLRRRGVRALDVRPDVQARYNERLQARMARTVWSSGCRSWYIDAHGKNTTLWPGFTFAFRWLTRCLRTAAYELIG